MNEKLNTRLLEQMIKDTNIEIVKSPEEDKVVDFINALKQAVAIDYIGEPFIRISDDKISLYVHTLPSGNDSPYDCYSLFKHFSIVNLKEVLS